MRMKVYLVCYDNPVDSNNMWEITKIFDSEEKAITYIAEMHNLDYYLEEREVE
jgi:hypothetical protein